MKRTLGAVFAVAVLATLLVLGPIPKIQVPVVHAAAGCTLATLRGNYAFIYTGAGAPGHSLRGLNNAPSAAVGVLAFDGAGNLSASYTVVFNGAAAETTSVPDTGTYTVNSDCTGTLTDATIDAHFNMVIVGGGAELFNIQTDAGGTNTLDAKKQ